MLFEVHDETRSVKKTESETETKVTVKRKPEEIQEVTSKVTYRSGRPKKEFFSGSVEIDSDYFILHSELPDSKFGNTTEVLVDKVHMSDKQVQKLLESGLNVPLRKEEHKSQKYFEISHSYKDKEGNKYFEKKFFPTDDPQVFEILRNPEYQVSSSDLDSIDVRESLTSSSHTNAESWIRSNMTSSSTNLSRSDEKEAKFESLANNASKTETLEEFIIEQEISTNAEGNEVTIERKFPVNHPKYQPPTSSGNMFLKTKTQAKKDHVIEITVVTIDSDGSEIEVTKRFEKDDPRIDDFIAGKKILSHQTATGKYFKTTVEETRSEKLRIEGSVDYIESTNTKIATTMEREFFEESTDVETESMMSPAKYQIETDQKSMIKKSFQVFRTGKIVGLLSYSFQGISITVKGRRVQQMFKDNQKTPEVGVFETRVNSNGKEEVEQNFYSKQDPEYWRLVDEGILPEALRKGQSFSHTEIVVEVSIGSEEGADLEEVFIYKPYDRDLIAFIEKNSFRDQFDQMLKQAMLSIVELGDTSLGHESDSSSSDAELSEESDVVVRVEHFEDLQGQIFVIVKYQSYMEEKIYKYPYGDPALLELVQSGTIPVDALPGYEVECRSISSSDVNDQKVFTFSHVQSESSSSDEEFIQITNDQGEKEHFKLDDPRLMEQIRGTIYEQELIDLRKSSSKKDISRETRKRQAVSQPDIQLYLTVESSDSETSSEEELDGLKVNLQVLLMENRIAEGGQNVVHVTKIYRNLKGDELEVQKQYDRCSRRIPKLMKRQKEVNSQRKALSYVENLNLLPQMEFLISDDRLREPKKRPRLSTSRGEREHSPVSKSMLNLQFEDYGEIQAENDVEINTWTFRAEEEFNEDGERFVHLFENKYGNETETIHRAESPTILDLIAAEELPETFLTPLSETETQKLVQRKFLVTKRQITENPLNLLHNREDPLSRHLIRVEDEIEPGTGNRFVLLSKQFIDEFGQETFNQQVHRPDSPTIVNLVDRGIIPAPFLLEEPEKRVIEEDAEGYFTEEVIKRRYERVNTDFVEIPTSPRTWSSYDDSALNVFDISKSKLKPNDFDLCEAEMDISDVKIAEEVFPDAQILYLISRQGRDVRGNSITKTTRHRPQSPTLQRYTKDKVPIITIRYPLSTDDLNTLRRENFFQPYLDNSDKDPHPQSFVNDPDWKSGTLMSQQTGALRFLDSVTLNQVYQSVDVKAPKGNAVKLSEWTDCQIDDVIVATEAVEQIDSNGNVILLKRVLQNRDGSLFQEIRSFLPNNYYIISLVNNNILPEIADDQNTNSPYSILIDSPALGKKHRRSSEKSEVLFETVKVKSPTSSPMGPVEEKFRPESYKFSRISFDAKLREARTDKGEKYLVVTICLPISESKQDIQLARFPINCSFISEIIKYNQLPVALKSLVCYQEGTEFDIKIPASLWTAGQPDALLIETFEHDAACGTPPHEKTFQTSLQQRIEAITSFRIHAKKNSKQREQPAVVSPMSPEEKLPYLTYDQQVSIKTVKLKSEDLLPAVQELNEVPLNDNDNEILPEQVEPESASRFISSILKRFSGFVVSEPTDTPNEVLLAEENWNISKPVALDLSDIVFAKVTVTEEEDTVPQEKAIFYDDPFIKLVLPDVAKDFEALPKEAKQEVSRRIEVSSKCRRASFDPNAEKVEEPLEELVEPADLKTRQLCSIPVEVYSVQAEQVQELELEPKSETPGEQFVMLTREMKNEDALESRKYPKAAPLIVELMKQGKILESPTEEQLDIPAIDWMASVGEIVQLSLVPTKAAPQPDSTSLSSFGTSASSSLPVSYIREVVAASTPDSLVDFESGYGSITPTRQLTHETPATKKATSDESSRTSTPSHVWKSGKVFPIKEEGNDDDPLVDTDDRETSESASAISSTVPVDVEPRPEVTPKCSTSFWKEESDEDEQEPMKPLATSEGMAFALVSPNDERIKG